MLAIQNNNSKQKFCSIIIDPDENKVDDEAEISNFENEEDEEESDDDDSQSNIADNDDDNAAADFLQINVHQTLMKNRFIKCNGYTSD